MLKEEVKKVQMCAFSKVYRWSDGKSILGTTDRVIFFNDDMRLTHADRDYAKNDYPEIFIIPASEFLRRNNGLRKLIL